MYLWTQMKYVQRFNELELYYHTVVVRFTWLWRIFRKVLLEIDAFRSINSNWEHWFLQSRDHIQEIKLHKTVWRKRPKTYIKVCFLSILSTDYAGHILQEVKSKTLPAWFVLDLKWFISSHDIINVGAVLALLDIDINWIVLRYIYLLVQVE